MKKFLFISLQCTWGLLPTLLGAIVFLIMIKCPHKLYHSCIDTRWKLNSGLSLGLFIFTPNDEDSETKKVRVHEYGHCIQSIVLGPLFLIIGFISLVWANHPYYKRIRREKRLPYTACFVESWASKWGEWATGEKAI